jgi:hypothetical protein
MFWLAQGREPRMTVYWAARLTPLWVTARHELSWAGWLVLPVLTAAEAARSWEPDDELSKGRRSLVSARGPARR